MGLGDDGFAYAQEPKPERGFIGWFIPAEIVELFDDEVLSPRELFLLAEIDSLSRKKDSGGVLCGCFASNAYLAKKMKFTKPNSISRLLKRLKVLGLIIEENFDGRQRYLFTKWTYTLRKRAKRSPKCEGGVRRNAKAVLPKMRKLY